MAEIPPPPAGFTLDQPAQPATAGGIPPPPAGFKLDQSWGDVAMDALKSIPYSAAKGVISPAASLGQMNAGEMMMPPEAMPSPESAMDIFQKKLVGDLHQPQSTTAKVFGGAIEAAANPYSYIGATSPAGLALSGVQALASGAASTGAGELVDNPTYKAPAQIAAGLAGGFTPNIAMKAITPNAASVAHLNDIKTLEQKGITSLTAGDRAGNLDLRAAESEVAGPHLNEKQKSQFVQAAFNPVREVVGGRRLTDKGGAIETMNTRVGGRFNELQERNHAAVDQDLMKDFTAIDNKFSGPKSGYDDETKNAVRAQLRHIFEAYNPPKPAQVSPYNLLHQTEAARPPGIVTGSAYKQIRSDVKDIAMSTDNDAKSRAMHEISEALDNNMERTIAAVNPRDLTAWKQARDDYRASLVLQRWGTRSKEATPDALKAAAINVYGEKAYAEGKTPFTSLAEAGSRALYPYKTSETARRGYVEKIAENVGNAVALAGFGAGYAGHGLEGGVLPGLAAHHGGILIGKALTRGGLMNDKMQGYLGNQFIPRQMQEEAKFPLSVRLARAIAQTQGQQ